MLDGSAILHSGKHARASFFEKISLPGAVAGQQALAILLRVAYNGALVTKKAFTAKQGQYLAFIFYYTKIHGLAPAESDMQDYFKVTPPSVHQMILTLEANGFIERVPGRARSIHLLIPRELLPDLE
jgi:repressor LexA